MILRIDPQADRLSLIEAVRQRLRERRIDFEPRRLDGALRLGRGDSLHDALRERQPGE